MTTAPDARLGVALEGFSGFERSALASTFQLAGNRFPAYTTVDHFAQAQFIVADADVPGVVRRIEEAARVADTVFVGVQAPEGALAWTMRPVDPLHVLRELDGAAAMRRLVASVAARSVPARRASDLPAPARSVAPEVLVVEADEPAARALERQLNALGLSAARAGSSGKAIELMARLPFRFVFVARLLGPQSDLQGPALCQLIARHPPLGAQHRPAVFLLEPEGDLHPGGLPLPGVLGRIERGADEAVVRRLLAAHGAVFNRHGLQRVLQR